VKSQPKITSRIVDSQPALRRRRLSWSPQSNHGCLDLHPEALDYPVSRIRWYAPTRVEVDCARGLEVPCVLPVSPISQSQQPTFPRQSSCRLRRYSTQTQTMIDLRLSQETASRAFESMTAEIVTRRQRTLNTPRTYGHVSLCLVSIAHRFVCFPASHLGIVGLGMSRRKTSEHSDEGQSGWGQLEG
jgi:hypothetical protein